MIQRVYQTNVALFGASFIACMIVVVQTCRRRYKGIKMTGIVSFISDVIFLLCACEVFITGIFFIINVSLARGMAPSKVVHRDVRWWALYIPLSWVPQFYRTYVASICYNWLVRGHSLTFLRRSFRPALKIIFLGVLGQFFFEIVLSLLKRFYGISRNTVILLIPIEHFTVFFINQSLLCFFYFETCRTLYTRLCAKETVKKRHKKIVLKFMLMASASLISSTCFTIYLFITFYTRRKTVTGMIFVFPVALAGFFDATIMGNACQLCCFSSREEKAPAAAGTSRGPASKKEKKNESMPHGVPVLGNRKLSGALSSVKYLDSFLAENGGSSAFKNREMMKKDGARIFVSTFNTGPVKKVKDLGADVSEWIPLGYDVYCIGFQECCCVEELRKVIHDYLGGPDSYCMYQTEVGPSTLLYGSIALTVFARSADVESGAFATVGAQMSHIRNGVDLVVTRAGNKGMVGLACRYHDCTLAFITAHYASDSAGKKRIHKRNEDAGRTLKDLRLTDDEGFNVQLQHHYTIVLGDLNYRMKLKAHKMVERIVESSMTLKDSVWEGDNKYYPCEEEDEEEEDDQGNGGVAGVVSPINFVKEGYMRLFHPDKDENAANSIVESAAASSSQVLEEANEEGDDDDDDDDDSDDDVDEESEIPASSSRIVRIAEGDSLPSTLDPLSATEPSVLERPWYNRMKSIFRVEMTTLGHTDSSSDGSAFSRISSSNEGSMLPLSSITSRNKSRINASPWAWISAYDELHLEMKAGRVFAGFSEGCIDWPPSFRWRTRGRAGDYTSKEQVAGAYVLKKKGDGERVPSYTDRILYHSLPDMKRRLRLVAYEMCDSMTGSDHRPVSAAFCLMLNRKVIGFTEKSSDTKGPLEAPASSVWSVQLHQMGFQYYVVQDLSVDSTSSRFRPSLLASKTIGNSQEDLAPRGPPQSDWTVHVYFPCVLEDPFFHDFKVQDIEAALLQGADVNDKIKRQHSLSWKQALSSKGFSFDVLVFPEVSRHALIRLVDAGGTEVGQGVICLRELFNESASSFTKRKAFFRRDDGVEVTMSTRGRIVGKLTVKIKIRHQQKKS